MAAIENNADNNNLTTEKDIVIMRVFERVAQMDQERGLTRAAVARCDYLVPFAWSRPVRSPLDILKNIRDVLRYAGAAFEVSTTDLVSHRDYPAFKAKLEQKGLRVEKIFVGATAERRHFPHIGITARVTAA